MARKMVSTWELHIEKAVVGISLLALIGSVAWFMLMGAPYKTEGPANEPVGPTELATQMRQSAEEVTQRFRGVGRYQPPTTKVETDSGEFTLANQPDLRVPAGPLRPLAPALIGGSEAAGKRERPLVKVVAPTHIDARALRNVIDLQPQRPFNDVVQKEDSPEVQSTLGAPQRPHSWVMCAGVIDLAEQEAQFRAAGYPPDKWDFVLYRVDMQRRQVLRTASGEQVGAWEDATPYVSYTPLPLPDLQFSADGAASSTDRIAFDDVVTTLHQPAAQQIIARPQLPRVQSGPGTGDVLNATKEPQIPYLRLEPRGFYVPGSLDAPATDNQDIVKEANAWRALAQKAAGLNPPDFDTAYLYYEAAYWAKGIPPATRDLVTKGLDELDKKFAAAGGKPPKRELRRRLPVIAYDLQVTPGLSYQYRMRAVVINRLAGQPNEFASAEDAKRVLIDGEWSAPTETLDIATDLYVFVTKVDAGKKVAQLELFRRLSGTNFEQTQVSVKIGDAIGRKLKVKGRDVDFSTGWIVIDVDPAYEYHAPGANGPAEQTQAVVYADASNPGMLHELIVAQDQSNAVFSGLKSGQAPGKTTQKRGGARP